MSIIYNNGKFYRVAAGAAISTVLTAVMVVALAIDARPRSLPDLELVANQPVQQIGGSVHG
jgi:anti-sigma-K factor RskA